MRLSKLFWARRPKRLCLIDYSETTFPGWVTVWLTKFNIFE